MASDVGFWHACRCRGHRHRLTAVAGDSPLPVILLPVLLIAVAAESVWVLLEGICKGLGPTVVHCPQPCCSRNLLDMGGIGL